MIKDKALMQMLNEINAGLKTALTRVNELVAENKALKEALAQDEQSSSQEPVAGDVHTEHCFQGEYKHCCKYGDGDDCTAAPKRPWVGLTATAKLDLLSTAKGAGGRINGDAQLLELLNEHETQIKRKNT